MWFEKAVLRGGLRRRRAVLVGQCGGVLLGDCRGVEAGFGGAVGGLGGEQVGLLV